MPRFRPILIPAPDGAQRARPHHLELFATPGSIGRALGAAPCEHLSASGISVWALEHPTPGAALNFDASDLLDALGACTVTPIYGPAIVTGRDHGELIDPPPLAVAFLSVLIHPDTPNPLENDA